MSTQNIPFSIYKKKKMALNYPKSAAKGFFQGTQERVETAVVNEPSVFELPKFYCIRFLVRTELRYILKNSC